MTDAVLQKLRRSKMRYWLAGGAALGLILSIAVSTANHWG